MTAGQIYIEKSIAHPEASPLGSHGDWTQDGCIYLTHQGLFNQL